MALLRGVTFGMTAVVLARGNQLVAERCLADLHAIPSALVAVACFSQFDITIP